MQRGLGSTTQKLEDWAFPEQDEAVKGIYEKYKAKIRQLLKLEDVWESEVLPPKLLIWEC